MSNRKKSIKQLLKALEPEALREILIGLAKNNKQNDKYIRFYIQGSDSSGLKELAEQGEKELNRCFFQRNGFPRFFANHAAARLILNQYNSVLRLSIREIVSLNLSYVEYCIRIKFGHDQRVVQSMLNAFKTAYYVLEKHPGYIKDFAGRLNSIYNSLDYLSEEVNDEYCFLEEKSGILLTLDEPDQIKNEVEPPKKEAPVFRLS